MRTIRMVVERDSTGGLVGTAPSLPGCEVRAPSPDELREAMARAVERWGEVREFVGVEIIGVGGSAHDDAGEA